MLGSRTRNGVDGFSVVGNMLGSPLLFGKRRLGVDDVAVLFSIDDGRYRTNVWDYAGVNTFRSGRED